MTNTEMLERWAIVRMYMDSKGGDYDEAMGAINELIEELKERR